MYYFSTLDKKLRHGDDRIIRAGITHKVKCDPVLCQSGLHASKRAIDALSYAPGPYVWRVELGGTIIHGDDKSVATERTYIKGYDATETLRHFARLCALDVIHLWNAPDIVVRYLKTGDESLRIAAGAAAWDAWAAAGAAAWAAWAAAGDAWDAGAAAWAAWDAGDAGAAAWAAWAALKQKQNRRLATMLAKGFK